MGRLLPLGARERRAIAANSHRPPAGLLLSGRLLKLVTPLAQPRIATIVAFIIYLIRASANPDFLDVTMVGYFNYLADAFLHGQFSLRQAPLADIDLIRFQGQTYLYWPPFPAILIMPLVAVFGVGISDRIYTALFGAISLGLLAKLLAELDARDIVPLSQERRAILVASCGFGSVLFILAPLGQVWFTSQVIGWTFVLLAAVSAISRPGQLGYFCTGLALSCAVATRTGLLFTGVWLAYWMLKRDWSLPLRQKLTRAFYGLLPLAVAVVLLGYYNVVRFGHPLQTGLAWHSYRQEYYGADFAQYGVFNLHYLPINVFHQFIILPYTKYKEGIGSGLFWMTPILLGAPYALWRFRHTPLIWALALSCLLTYIPIGLVMGVGYVFGSRYLLDLMVPLIVMAAMGIRAWRLDILQLLMIASWATFAIGSVLMILSSFATGS